MSVFIVVLTMMTVKKRSFMRKFLRSCISLCLFANFVTSAVFGKEIASAYEYPGIVAYVEESIILQQDLNDRVNIIKMSSGGKYDKEMDKAALTELVSEKVREHVLRKYSPAKGWTDSREIDAIFESIAKQNNMSADTFAKLLQKQNVNVNSFKHSIEVNIAWNRYIEARYSSSVNVSQYELNEIKKGIAEQKNQPAFYLSRIYIPIDEQSKKQGEAEVQQIMKLLKNGAQFADVARRFSKSPDAQLGGDIGWVSANQLSLEEAKVVPTIGIGKSAVVKTNSGYFILNLKDKREAGQNYSVSVEFVQVAVPRPELAGGQDTRQLLVNLKSSAQNVRQFIDNAKNIGCFVSHPIKMQLEGMMPNYREVIKQTNEGQMSGIVSDKQALFVFCVLKKIKNKIPEKTEEQLRQDHINLKLAKCSAQSLSEQKSKSHIRYTEQGLKILSQK